MATLNVGYCCDCKHWSKHTDASPIYNTSAIAENPELAERGLCEHPESKMHPEFEGAAAISTHPDFGCVQFSK